MRTFLTLAFAEEKANRVYCFQVTSYHIADIRPYIRKDRFEL